MKTSTRFRYIIAVLMLVALCFSLASPLFAQPTGSGVPLPALSDTNAPIADADAKIIAVVHKFSYWQGMILPVTMALVWAIKKYVKLIPDKYLPWTAPIVGGLLDMLASKFGLWTGNAVVGAAMGAAATWAHQWFNQMKSGDVEEKQPTGIGRLGVFFIIGCLAFGSATALTGCSIFGVPNRTVAAKKFDTYKLVRDAAEVAYKQFKRDCFHGKVTARNEARGDKAWNDFNIAFQASFRIGMEDVAAPSDVITLKNTLIQVIKTL